MDGFRFVCLLSIALLSVLETIGGQYSRCPIDVRRAISCVRSPCVGHVEVDNFLILFPSRRVALGPGHPAADGERGGSPLQLAGREPLSSLLPTPILYTRDISCQESKNKTCFLSQHALIFERGVIRMFECISTTSNFPLVERIENKLDAMR